MHTIHHMRTNRSDSDIHKLRLPTTNSQIENSDVGIKLLN